ncbi:MAG TPA: cytochrome c biogenesis protein CcsA [Gemmatimonadaceae bacterium]|nr:cytochrome c biogenesis protein CcsA [Gemmatimonadaceae bacterium]
MPSSLTGDLTTAHQPPVSTAPSSGARRGVDWLVVVALLAAAAAFGRALYFTPTEAMQGPAQKIMYMHVPAAVVGLYLCMPLLAIASGVYLWLKDERLDRVAESAAEVGLLFLSVVLLTGPLWGKPIWGTYWTWDARLTSTLFLWFVLLGYLVLRDAIEEHGMRARFSAVIGVLTLLLVPFIHLSVYLFRTLHPMPIVLKPEKPSMPAEMQVTLLVSFIATALLFVAFLRARYRLATRRDALVAREEAL